jgi:hypothetical protein
MRLDGDAQAQIAHSDDLWEAWMKIRAWLPKPQSLHGALLHRDLCQVGSLNPTSVNAQPSYLVADDLLGCILARFAQILYKHDRFGRCHRRSRWLRRRPDSESGDVRHWRRCRNDVDVTS